MRLRRSGTTIHSDKPQSLPRFHLRPAALNLTLDSAAGAMRGVYALRIADVTTDPAIVGRPTAFSLTRPSGGAAAESLPAAGSPPHPRARQRDTTRVPPPGRPLPRLPVARGT